MKTYSIWFSETDTYKMFFQAESLEEAEKLIYKVRSGELDTTDLPKMEKVGKNYEEEFATETLEELGDK